MQIGDKVINFILHYLPFIATAIGLGAALWIAHRLLIGRHPDLNDERRFPRQIIMLGLALIGLVALVLVLPIEESSRNKLIGLIGLLISGIVALSSTTIVANFMSGILLRVTKPFRIGDFIRIGDHFGRVSARGLFDTEIQSQSREFIAIPNAYLLKNPVTTIRSSGTIISVALSLGYDVHHAQVEALLIKAAEESGLEEPFVQILELGNYSITYRISGFLAEVKWLITARSELSRAVLDVLHDEGIEIMSPLYMNQRRIGEDQKIIPAVFRKKTGEKPALAEEVAFDKAEQAERIEKEKEQLKNEIEELESSLEEASDEDKKRIKEKIKKNRDHIEGLENKGDESTMEGHAADSGIPPSVADKSKS